jgi:hypothetical protein
MRTEEGIKSDMPVISRKKNKKLMMANFNNLKAKKLNDTINQ